VDWSIDRDSDEDLQDQIEEFLRDLIKRDEYQRGKLLPGDVEIAERLEVSRNTVREAMSRLVEDGLIVRKKGFGSKVDRGKVDTNLRAWSDLAGEIEDNGTNVQEQERDLSFVLPPKRVVNAFDVDPVIKLPKLERVIGDDTGPIALLVSHFHPRLGIDEDETFERRLYQDVLEPKYGIRPETSDERIETEMPDKEIQNSLDLERQLPILFRERVVSDENGDPFEFNECYYRGDRFRFRIEMTRDGEIN
jgi:GntR family transcriptional regulator